MGGVDISDQLRSYFTQNLRCRRTWMPLMLFSLNVIATNSYIIHKGTMLCFANNDSYPAMQESRKESPLSHKKFHAMFTMSLSRRAFGEDRRNFVPNPRPTKRVRMSHLTPKLPPERMDNQPHHLVKPSRDAKQKKCRYCAYLSLLDKKEGRSPGKIRRPTSYCLECQVHLCSDPCMAAYHRRI